MARALIFLALVPLAFACRSNRYSVRDPKDIAWFEEARRSFERDHQLNTESGDTRGVAQSAGNLAEALAALGEFEKARELWQTALPVFDDQGDRLWSALADKLTVANSSLQRFRSCRPDADSDE